MFSGSINSHVLNFEGSHYSQNRYLAFNVHQDNTGSPSDFNSVFVGFDPLRHQIVKWSLGTGKVIEKLDLEVDSIEGCLIYKGFKSHLVWD